VIPLGTQSIEGSGEISQALPEGELTEAQTQQVIPASKIAYPIIAIVAGDNFMKLIFGNYVHKLRKNEPTSVHDYVYF